MPPLTPIVGTQTIHPNNEKAQVTELQYTEEAKKYINFRRQRLIASRDTRDAPRDEHDGLPFLKWYETMKRADDAYIAPRKNKQDTAINLGTIRDKDTTLVEFAQKYDFEPIAQVYDDEDEMLEDLAETAEDMVRKSFMLEDMKTKAKLISRSTVAFGTALVEDTWIERWSNEKKFGKDFKIGSEKADWTEQKVKTYDGCQAKLWDLRKCYFGDIRKFFMNGPLGQPYFFTVEYESYDVCATWFGDWERWKYVPTQVVMSTEVAAATNFSNSWTLRPVSANYVEIIRYYDPIANEYAITLNGVDMLPIMEKEYTTEDGQKKCHISGFPLTAISPSGAINFAKFDLEPMHDSAYSKAQPAKMRVLGDVENMYFKIMLRMMKQKADPTLGNKSGKQFGSEVTDPATVINDMREGDLFPILPNYQGANAGDFSFYEIIKKEMDKNSVERSFQGKDGSDPNKETATQNMNDAKSQTLQVAALFDGLVSGYTQLFWLRTYNIAQNWTKPIDIQIDVFKKSIENKYRTVTMPTESESGQEATKKIIFTKDTPKLPVGKKRISLEDSQNIHQDEMDAYKNGEGEVRNVYLHPVLFSTMKLSWFYSCMPVINESDPLAYMMFAKQINDAITFFGPDSLNVKRLKRKFAKMTGNDYDTWFLNQQELQQKQEEAQQQMNAGQTGNIPGQKPGGNPTIAGAASGAKPMAGMAAVMR